MDVDFKLAGVHVGFDAVDVVTVRWREPSERAVWTRIETGTGSAGDGEDAGFYACRRLRQRLLARVDWEAVRVVHVAVPALDAHQAEATLMLCGVALSALPRDITVAPAHPNEWTDFMRDERCAAWLARNGVSGEERWGARAALSVVLSARDTLERGGIEDYASA